METNKLYHGEVKLQFNSGKHHYTVDGQTIDGVTSILKVIDKPALIAWAANQAAGYFQSNVKVGDTIDEIQLKNLVEGAKSAYRKFSKNAADIGTIFHEWVESYVKASISHEQIPELPTNEMLRNSAKSFLKWAKNRNVEFKSCERKIYSRKYNYAGTLDFTAVVDGKLVVGDIKTSSGIWDEYWLQLAAYKQALQEEFPEYKIDHTCIVRCGKDGSFEVQELNDFEQNFKAFEAALNLYRWQKAMKFKNYITQ